MEGGSRTASVAALLKAVSASDKIAEGVLLIVLDQPISAIPEPDDIPMSPNPQDRH